MQAREKKGAVDVREKLQALTKALATRDWGDAPVDRARYRRIRLVEHVNDDGETYQVPVLDELEVGHEAVVFVEGPPVPIERDGEVEWTRYRVVRMFNLELLDDCSPEEVAEMLAPGIEDKFKSGEVPA